MTGARTSTVAGSTAADDANRAALVALVGLPGVGPARLRALLADRCSAAVWDELVAGRLPAADLLAGVVRAGSAGELMARWRDAARGVDPAAVLTAHRAAGIEVLVAGDVAWPAALDADPDPPLALFAIGRLDQLGAGPAVAVVGTRQASRYGLDVARQLGTDLSAAGVSVVSGLAAGIDGAAHHGVLDAGGAPPLGIVGSGLDVVYPRGHRQLWRRVADAGVLLSEAPLGMPPARWRFPARNRLIAALSLAVVVVESPPTGGSMHTVDEAVRRDRAVLAVPGPVTSRGSRGTNRLLADGAAPACDAGDVLVAVGLGRAQPPARPTLPPPPGDAGRVLDALGWEPSTLDQLVLRSGLSVEVVIGLTSTLVADGWLANDGGWFERRR